MVQQVQVATRVLVVHKVHKVLRVHTVLRVPRGHTGHKAQAVLKALRVL